MTTRPPPRTDAAAASRAELVAALDRVAGGDRRALEDVYRRTSAKLFGVVLRILPDRQEAEDVLQEVYITVWTRAGGFDGARGSPITWLVALARNRAIDRVRAGGGRRFAGPDALAHHADDAPLASETIQTRQTADRIHDCLDRLDARHADAVRRAFLGGQTYEVLAGQLEVPLGTLKSWIRRALIRLRACVDQADG